MPTDAAEVVNLGHHLLANKRNRECTSLFDIFVGLTERPNAQRQQLPTTSTSTLIDQVTAHLEYNADSATLKSTAAHFGYHPVYISRLLPEKTGKAFSQLLLESKMRKAHLLINHTDLSIEKIAAMLGYSNSSNFYKAFKHYYGTSLRRWPKN